ncbi:hypothetical protein TD95_002000 [Thielaviopsis punctulata]|uniref:E3 ubiquitin-protein ligase n=1 Tax=Thielaviopsis punctulata TaxID=72032 RepID=A0A0F4ZJ59_9PEZI|nr:hypothetical protein TD95_002000 [Thielaviopsis punctulata]
MASSSSHETGGSHANLLMQQQQLCTFLRDYPMVRKYKYTNEAALFLKESLFRIMIGGKDEYMKLLFPNGKMPADMKLREAQGAIEGSEYTEAARGKRCGHILKSGEASYMCRTCSVDDTCCLCSRCYHATNHEGHQIRISISSGNSGCCDCGDEEAWKVPMVCTIHSEREGGYCNKKDPEPVHTPPDLVKSMVMTIGRVLDYVCDVISCSPEQLRLMKTIETIKKDARDSILNADKYFGEETIEDEQQYCLIVWNDEKHTLRDVQDQIARACNKRQQVAYDHAIETDSIGRSILVTSTDLPGLLRMARKLEEIRVTITIRSARDTFREQMCATIIDWLHDISGCSVGNDHKLLLHTVCEQMLKPWQQGSSATNRTVGKHGISDEAHISEEIDHQRHLSAPLLREWQARFNRGQIPVDVEVIEVPQIDDFTDDDDEEGDFIDADMADIDDIDEDDQDLIEAREIMANQAWTIQPGINENGDIVEIPVVATGRGLTRLPLPPPPVADEQTLAVPEVAPPQDAADAAAAATPDAPAVADSITVGDNTDAEAATVSPTATAGSPTAAPAAPVSAPALPQVAAVAAANEVAPSEAESADATAAMAPAAHPKVNAIPKTPGQKRKDEKSRPGKYWTEVPELFYAFGDGTNAAENIFAPVRLDHLIMFDLRMWKKMRNDIRSFYISRIASVPEYKLILGRRFAAFYTTLAQLYLIGDREPDHSIINLSLQMFTTASITKELVEKANFLTHLFAILYTFLTTRQVNYPWEVSSTAVLAFDSGSVTNRRMYHFYMDLKHLFDSEHVKMCLRKEEKYLLQFLDLVKLHQGIGPNIRAVGEHVEYETDSWITASLVTREINRMTFKFSLAFADITPDDVQDVQCLKRAIRTTAKTLILHCLGGERERFVTAEIKDETKFKGICDYEFDQQLEGVKIVDFVVHKESISFHHAMHYMLSWLIERGRFMDADELRSLLSFTFDELLQQPRTMGSIHLKRFNLPAEDFLINLFDYPLRVCAWLAQIKTNMWVRNGVSLRHQAASYRGVTSRDVCHQRDLLMLQTAMVTCDPARVLASIVDRFDQAQWVRGIFEINCEGQDSKQHLDVVEDMIHLIITILSDRCALIPAEKGVDQTLISMRRDLIHVLCLKPLSFSDICNKLPDRYQDHPKFNSVLHELSKFEFREGVSDVGSFELKPEYAREIDIFISHYTRNQREEAEVAYRKSMAALTGKKPDEIIYEPNLMPIPSGVFKDLARLVHTGMFAQIIYYCLSYSLQPDSVTSSMPASRIEVFLNSVLHLILIAVVEDNAGQDQSYDQSSFIRRSLQQSARVSVRHKGEFANTIAGLLRLISQKPEYSSCHSKIDLIMSKIRQKQPNLALEKLGASLDTASDPVETPTMTAEEERERKKKAALSRTAKVMAQFQKQQQDFLGRQAEIDWGSDISDEDDDDAMQDSTSEHKKTWKFPSDTCLQCQEKTDDRKLFGTFAMFTESRVVRATDLQNQDVVREVIKTPESLDQQMDRSHPSGISGENKIKVVKYDANGQELEMEESCISKGFPNNQSLSGPVSVSCGHLMHYSCFKTYYDAMVRRQTYQIARHHPEDPNRHEFVCPLCKALCNAFVPIIWKPREERYPHVLKAESDIAAFLEQETSNPFYNQTEDSKEATGHAGAAKSREVDLKPIHIKNAVSTFAAPLADYITHTYGCIDIDEPEALENRLTELARPEHKAIAPSENAKNIMSEMVKVYETFNVSLRSQEFCQSQPFSNARVRCFNDTMIRAVAFTISAAEIQQRGVGSSDAASMFMGPRLLIDNVPETTMTYLKILAETTTAYLSINCLQFTKNSNSIANIQFQYDARQQLKQLFICDYFDSPETIKIPPVLAIDGFVLLTDYAYCLSAAHNIEISHLVRLCYLAEVVRVVQRVISNIPSDKWYMRLHSVDEQAPDNIKAFADFCSRLMDMTLDAKDSGDSGSNDNLKNHGFEQPGLETLEGIYLFVQKYALAYLRKTAILMHAKYGVDFSAFVPSNAKANELARLTEALQVPTFDDICAALLPSSLSCGWPDTIPQVVSGWIRHHLSFPITSCNPPRDDKGWLEKQRSFVPMALAHPGVFELIGLPREFDTLIDEATRRRCPTTGQDIQDATICLLCGEIFCAQSTCCLKELQLPGNNSRTSIGGAQNHMRKCQGIIGMFINIRKCCSFYLFRQSGSYAPAPYLDCYGETDMGLRHGRQLFLNQKRYDKIRTMFLTHGVPSLIARKLEADVNNGGWETI